jgi:hypothetical protein
MFMITGVLSSFIPERITPWLFGLEAAAAILVAALFGIGTLIGGVWGLFAFVWYAIYCAVLYFHWDRRRTLKKDEKWTPTPLAKASAIVCFAGMAALGAGIAYWSFGASIQAVVVGLVILAIGVLELVAVAKRGWPRLGF